MLKYRKAKAGSSLVYIRWHARLLAFWEPTSKRAGATSCRRAATGHQSSAMMRRRSAALTIVVAAGMSVGTLLITAPRSGAAPVPEVEYMYNVAVRRHYNFPNGDAIGYGHEICDRVSRGDNYAQVMTAVKSAVTPNDEFAANYLISYAVNLLCPSQIWQLRNSAGGYQPPPQ